MKANEEQWRPVARPERFASLDILRGLALIGVLLINIWSGFRIPLAENLLTFHVRQDGPDRMADMLLAGVLEFKAMTIFCLLFGAGSAIFAERASARGASAPRFLFRRYLALLGIGLCHLLLLWNGDILTLYAVCAFLLLPLLRTKAPILATVGIVAIAISFCLNWGFLWPTEETLHRLAAEATRVYQRGSLADTVAFHWRETKLLILPLLVASVPQAWGLMALGAGCWRAGVFQKPEQHARLLWAVTLVGGMVGATTAALSVIAKSTGHPAPIPSLLIDAGSVVPLALAYAAGLLLLLRSPDIVRAMAPFGAVGQMALTNYLMQSVVLSLIFYGYGLGLANRLGSAAATGIGVALYTIQMICSIKWLQRFRFGPVEWLWRSFTYGRWQPLRRDTDASD